MNQTYTAGEEIERDYNLESGNEEDIEGSCPEIEKIPTTQ